MNKRIILVCLTMLAFMPSFSRQYKVSIKGQNLIKKYEKLSLHVYDDAGHKAIGWGHRLLKNEHHKLISSKGAQVLFNRDMAEVNKAINLILEGTNKNIVYSQKFIDGIGSLIYNCGATNIKRTVFYKRLCKCRIDKRRKNVNKRDIEFALAAVKHTYIAYRGNIERRNSEYKMMTD